MEPVGIKETKEAVIGLIVLAGALGEVLKDGPQTQDFPALFAKLQGDPVAKAKLEAAAANIQAVPAEVKDLSLMEGFELINAVAPEIIGLIGVVKK